MKDLLWWQWVVDMKEACLDLEFLPLNLAGLDFEFSEWDYAELVKNNDDGCVAEQLWAIREGLAYKPADKEKK